MSASRKTSIAAVGWILTVLSGPLLPAAPPPQPLARAHAHNDYEHPRPLLDALDHGFCSVEADVHCVDGKLLVAHDRDETQPERTLEALYLRPLHTRIELNQGRVYRAGPDFTLLIDFKTDANTTYAALEPLLASYQDILTQFTPHSTRTNAVTVILSGNRPREILAGQNTRYAALDGRLPDLSQPAPLHLIPLISDNWGSHFSWRGEGPLPEEQRNRLRALVAQAHKQGQRIRFWSVPDLPIAWRELNDAGVDYINTDNLAGLQRFLLAQPGITPAPRALTHPTQ